jgi:hypothetical protein
MVPALPIFVYFDQMRVAISKHQAIELSKNFNSMI